MIDAPFSADENPFDRDAERDHTGFREQQSGERAQDRVNAKPQRANEEHCKDQPLGNPQHPNAEEVVEHDPGQKEGEGGRLVGCILGLERGACKLHRWVSCHRDGLAGPRAHLSPEADIAAGS